MCYGVNTPSRWGTQAPFTNITLDWTVPDDLKKKPAIVGGREMNFTYGDCKEEMDMINKAFIEVMIEGDAQAEDFSTRFRLIPSPKILTGPIRKITACFLK